MSDKTADDGDEFALPPPPPRATLAHWLQVALWPGVSDNAATNNRLLREAHMHESRTIASGPLKSVADEHQVMRVVPDPGHNSGAVIAGGARPGPPRPVVTSTGGVDLVCGSCGFIICRAVGNPRQFAHLLFRCPACEHIVVLDPADRTAQTDHGDQADWAGQEADHGDQKADRAGQVGRAVDSADEEAAG